jgi:hypothetical protein
MIRNPRLTLFVSLASLTTMTAAAQAGSIYRCTQADGSITLSDTACPADSLTHEYRGEATTSGRPRSPSKDPWSVMNQVRKIEQRETAERKAASAGERQGGKRGAAKAPAPDRSGKPSYQEAHRRALEAAGYSEDSQLSKTQRDRVAEELTKDGYSLREPAKKKPTHERKSQTPGAGAASTTAPDPATAVDPRNANLTPHP